ncbi:hypothetical protein [Croceivirga lutea]|uniref:hypothetical protein n=1 Tax=Croceivirga lutea TaxID=1775167 RepID=UPI00163982A8|nr:hypothetical protein [Croceivirga lutea]
MNSNRIVLFVAIGLLTIMVVANSINSNGDYIPLDSLEISAADNTENFSKLMDVLTHPRCMNCHPNDNIPKQGIDRHPHYFDMARGEDDHGFKATSCNTCHQSENNPYSGVPGAPHWALAPASMGWQGLSHEQIAQRLLDKSTNGGKDHKALVEHLTQDKLVLWAWEPGVDANGNLRETPPISKEEYIQVVEEWFANGAVIPVN